MFFKIKTVRGVFLGSFCKFDILSLQDYALVDLLLKIDTNVLLTLYQNRTLQVGVNMTATYHIGITSELHT